MNSKLIAALAATATALMLTACGDSGGTTTPSSTPSPGSAAPAAGNSTASVDGKEFDAKFETTCAEQGGVLALALTDTANANYGTLSVSASLQGDTVQAVAFAGSQGGANGLPYAVGYGNGAPGGSAELTKDGNTFRITGEGVSAPDMANPLAGPSTVKFDVTFACSTIVGA
ncbi:lipoprotein LpqH [Nocardia mangyaensis]|uniref:lipoprotein LpqH n=1 Tax=Nocardia mangyaensis TaxID=2213200 RepID=UPI0026746C1F|nr:lipoprotein LpqH [Nocardia mangyaensis]MDO3649431.1 lipoprotein LpqH [Nocardia mangyaensis]